MLGKSLLLPRFFFLVSTLDTVECLESVLTEEPMLMVLDLFFCDQPWEFSSSWLKYSISCIRRDPTVPLVPISTGGNSAICCVACGKGGRMYALFCWCQGESKIGIEEERFVVCLKNFSTSCGIFFSFTKALHTMYYLYEVCGIYYVYGCRVSW